MEPQTLENEPLFKTPLQRLRAILADLGLITFLSEPTEESPFEQLLVSLDIEEEEAPQETEAESDLTYVLFMMFNEDMFPGQVSEAAPVTLQFFMSLNIPLPSERLLDIHRFMAVLNGILPLGSFNINEELESPQVYYRYNLMAGNKNISVPVILEIIETLTFFIHLMVPRIAALAEGMTTREALIELVERELADSAA